MLFFRPSFLALPSPLHYSSCMPSREFTITGKVQGVYYRAMAKKKADQYGVTGWVANNADGSVTVHAEGPDRAINDLEDWCRVGPTDAHVKEVTVKDAPLEYPETFEVVY
ncbi:MAG: acylphosphatase [Candidatus Peribacteria bacterium]|nr:acylphosphatase [Candidatus Peribacteria bacterium]